MSNNISRKGLAWGALVAIAASLFATAPAHAAAGISLTANSASQSLSVPTGTSFQLLATSSAEIPNTSWNTLAVKVTTNNASAVTVTVGSRTSQATAATAGSSVTFKSDDAGMNLQLNNQTIEVRGSASTTATATVTVWLDSNRNGSIDSGEYSAAQTVTFLGAADLTASTSFVYAPTYTSDFRTVQVRTELTNVNIDQLKLNTNDGLGIAASNISIDLRSGTYDVRDYPRANAAAAVFASSDARFYAYDGIVNAGTGSGNVKVSGDAHVWYSGAVFTAQAYWGTTAIGAKVSSSTSGLINNAATNVAIGTVKGSNADGTAVRTNSAFQVSATIRGDVTSNLTGASVKFAVSTANWETTTIRVTVNGTTYATSADLRAATWNVAADANGNALLNVAVAGSNAGDAKTSLTFTATSANLPVASVTVVQTDAAATTGAATPESQAVVLGHAANVTATLKDQWGVLFTKAYIAQVTYQNGVGSATSNTFGTLVGGTVTVPVTVDGTVTGTTHYNVDLAPQSANGTVGSSFATIGITVVTRTAAELAVGYVVNVVTSATRISVDAKALAGTTGGSTAAQSVSGRAVVTGDRGVPYAAVTVAGAGLFVLGTDGNFATGSVVVNADANGYFTASVRSNTSGTIAGTVASGSATAVAFNVVVDLAGASAGVSVDAPASYQVLAGTSTQVTFDAKDVFGNLLSNELNGNASTLSVHVSGDITRDVYGVDTKGYLTAVLDAPSAKTGTAYVTATYSSSARLITKQVRVDWVKAVVTVTLPDTVVAGQNADVVVTVTNPAGDAISGVDVSATSTGVGYLTVASGKTDSNGQATLKLYANENELGWAYVTAAGTPTGSVAATSDATGVQVVAPDAIPTATDSVAAIALEVPATAQAGTVVDVVATATDADGNPVSGAVVSATSTGVGYLAIAGGTTDDNGQVVLKLVIGAGDNGAASVVANSGSAQSDAAQVTAGATDANITLNKKRVTVDWSFAANKKVVIVRDGVAIKSFTASSNAADSFSFNLKKGTHKVSVKVGGVTLDSQSYKIAK